ncbi:hypothetical protein AMECASPLE_022789 [Ameca splendens]|uniref:Immunoglobulin I-set domain-containing protein n=1 Tax=Ameca splendens TaxID=208324 RepID=A0ABV0Z2B8_9TELE
MCIFFQRETELQPCGRISMYELSGRHFLEVNDVQEEDAGRYTCSVINSAGTATASAELIVQGVSEASPSVHPSEKPPAKNLIEDTIAPSPSRASADQQHGQTVSWRTEPPAALPRVAGRSTAAVQVTIVNK